MQANNPKVDISEIENKTKITRHTLTCDEKKERLLWKSKITKRNQKNLGKTKPQQPKRRATIGHLGNKQTDKKQSKTDKKNRVK